MNGTIHKWIITEWCLLSIFLNAQMSNVVIIENFDDGSVELISYEGEDIQPDSWALVSENTYNNSPYSLKLFGNTWKVEMIEPRVIQSGDVWQVAAYIQEFSEIQGFGVIDSAHTMFYSFAGSEELDIEEWVTVYQGSFPEEVWNTFQLPVADDWFAWYEYYPTIIGIVFVNDSDENLPGTVYFDDILNITPHLPTPPHVEIYYLVGDIFSNSMGLRSVDIQFVSLVTDPDSDEHKYFWYFGDDSTSTEENPTHTFLVEDDHPYTVLLEVVDDTDKWGQASVQINVDVGETSFPVEMNFVGDIMLARGYEYPGGIIPTLGVETIFEPTLSILGESADITVANLECPLTTHDEHHPAKPIYFKGSPDNVAGLVYAGIDIVSLANNHGMDYMLEGLQETQFVLTENNIRYSGAGANSYEAYLPTFYQESGLNIAFLASSDRTGQYNNYQPYLNAGYNKPGFAYMTPYYIQQQISVVEDIADLIVVEMHGGSEYSTDPGSNYDNLTVSEDTMEEEDYSPFSDIPHMWDIEIRHHAIDSGADLVVVHHPHIIHGLEVYNGKLIAHSLGNFVFDLSYPETFPSMILNAKINETGFYEYSITPVYIDDYIPLPAVGELGIYILDYLAIRSKELNTTLHVDRENILAYVIMDTLGMASTNVYCRNEIFFDEIANEWISRPLHLPRIGNISSIVDIPGTYNWEFRLGRELIWMGNFEDEGSTLWNVNSNYEWYDSTEAYAGERSLHHLRLSTSSDNVVTNLEGRIRCYADSCHSLHGYIKTQNGADVTIEIQYYHSRTGPTILGTEDIGVQITGDSDWTFYQTELTLPWGTKYFDIRLNSNVPQIGEANSWFDNVGVIEWSEWESLSFTEEITNPNDYYFIQLKSNDIIESTSITFTETIYDQLLPPFPEFSAEETVGSVPFEVSFIDESTGAVGYWQWDFGDSTTSILQNPVHTYTEPGIYTVSLTILDYQGNPITNVKQNYIEVFEGYVIIVDHLSDWNMVGLPFEVEDANHVTFFPNAIENTLYSFQNGYIQENELTIGTGYWLRIPNAGSNIINGDTINEITIGLTEGWNMISGLHVAVPMSGIDDPSGVIIPNTCYTYEGGYIPSTTIEPGKGYWLCAGDEGKITISNDAGAARKTFVNRLNGANTLTFTNDSGKMCKLYFGVTVIEEERLSYSLPPIPPPTGGFDVRFDGDMKVVEESGVIDVMNNSELLIIFYNVVLDTEEHKKWILTSSTGKEYVLNGSGVIEVAGDIDRLILSKRAIIPEGFVLHQNYPNPFNPITTIRYDLPKQSYVTIVIYDILGREVKELVSGELVSGYHKAVWDGTDSFGTPVGAGVYLYQIRGGDFIQTHKMLLLK